MTSGKIQDGGLVEVCNVWVFFQLSTVHYSQKQQLKCLHNGNVVLSMIQTITKLQQSHTRYVTFDKRRRHNLQ